MTFDIFTFCSICKYSVQTCESPRPQSSQSTTQKQIRNIIINCVNDDHIVWTSNVKVFHCNITWNLTRQKVHTLSLCLTKFKIILKRATDSRKREPNNRCNDVKCAQNLHEPKTWLKKRNDVRSTKRLESNRSKQNLHECRKCSLWSIFSVYFSWWIASWNFPCKLISKWPIVANSIEKKKWPEKLCWADDKKSIHWHTKNELDLQNTTRVHHII